MLTAYGVLMPALRLHYIYGYMLLSTSCPDPRPLKICCHKMHALGTVRPVVMQPALYHPYDPPGAPQSYNISIGRTLLTPSYRIAESIATKQSTHGQAHTTLLSNAAMHLPEILQQTHAAMLQPLVSAPLIKLLLSSRSGLLTTQDSSKSRIPSFPRSADIAAHWLTIQTGRCSGPLQRLLNPTRACLVQWERAVILSSREG